MSRSPVRSIFRAAASAVRAMRRREAPAPVVCPRFSRAMPGRASRSTDLQILVQTASAAWATAGRSEASALADRRSSTPRSRRVTAFRSPVLRESVPTALAATPTTVLRARDSADLRRLRPRSITISSSARRSTSLPAEPVATLSAVAQPATAPAAPRGLTCSAPARCRSRAMCWSIRLDRSGRAIPTRGSPPETLRPSPFSRVRFSTSPDCCRFPHRVWATAVLSDLRPMARASAARHPSMRSRTARSTSAACCGYGRMRLRRMEETLARERPSSLRTAAATLPPVSLTLRRMASAAPTPARVRASAGAAPRR